MTIQELYNKMEGNYDQAVRVMKSDRLIDKYIRKLKSSQIDIRLADAAETMDAVMLFESAHAMKGVCANLGLEKLAAAADEITEEFRQGNPRKMTDEEVKAKLAAISEQYRMTADAISEYEAG